MTHLTAQRGQKLNDPFIRCLVPFVCEKSRSVFPIVGCKLPNVGFSRKTHGFTLIELMITVTVIGIVGVIAVPAMTSLIKNDRITTQTNLFIADLNLAKSEALKRGGDPVVACARGTGGAVNNCDATAQYTNGWLVFVDANRNNSFDAGEVTLRDRPALENRLTLQSLAPDATCLGSTAGPLLVFSGRGAAATGSGCYAVCDDRANPALGREIVVGLSGQIRVVPRATRCT